MFKAPACEALQTKLRFKSFCPRGKCVCGGRGAGGGGSEANRAASRTGNYTAACFGPHPTAGAWAACQTQEFRDGTRAEEKQEACLKGGRSPTGASGRTLPATHQPVL